VTEVRKALGVSERRACEVLGQVRKTQRHSPEIKDEEVRLTERIIDLATQYGRYGYRRITAMCGGKIGRSTTKEWRESGEGKD
jgi:putative transposase